ncbi:hypothetical protein ACPPVV_08030 [Rhodanobacter sp. Col0626]|uniref:hypothetical protein n=1 Tax=Rhodanobacter sp. Col0626 TaxID=3415679 RepID=UPI003CEA0B50
MRPILLATLVIATLGQVHAQALLQTPSVQSPERRDVLDAARTKVQSQLGKPVRFKVEQLRLADSWAYLHATMQDAQGQAVSYTGTRYEEADRHGLKSAKYDALLRRVHGRWTVKVDSIGATDVPWTSWSRDHGAPSTLFGDNSSP